MPSKYDETIRSRESVEPASFKIKNTTGRPVDVLWINYMSQQIRYRTLRPGQEVKMNSFRTHPWIFRDCCTGILMHVDHKEVYWPEPITEERPIQHVQIHFPMCSLKTLSLWATAIRVKKITEISTMEIPYTLRPELETLFKGFVNHHIMIQTRFQRRQNQ